MSRIAIWMPEEVWINSQLSLARYSGGATIGGHQYIIVDKHGRDIYEGDILKVGSEKTKIEVRFVRGVFAFLWNGDLDDEFPCNAPTQEWAEVVGNIHDNPKMIKRR